MFDFVRHAWGAIFRRGSKPAKDTTMTNLPSTPAFSHEPLKPRQSTLRAARAQGEAPSPPSPPPPVASEPIEGETVDPGTGEAIELPDPLSTPTIEDGATVSQAAGPPSGDGFQVPAPAPVGERLVLPNPLAERLRQAEQANDNLQSRLDSAMQVGAERGVTIRSLEDDLATAHGALKAANERCSAVEAERDNFRAEAEDANAENARIVEQYNALLAEYKRLDGDYSVLRSKVDALKGL